VLVPVLVLLLALVAAGGLAAGWFGVGWFGVAGPRPGEPATGSAAGLAGPSGSSGPAAATAASSPASTASGPPATSAAAPTSTTASARPSASTPARSPAGAPSHGTPVPAAGGWWHPAAGLSWQWQLSGSVDLSVPAAVYDLDGDDTDAATVAAVHARGARAVCYLETGAWESYRADAGSYPSSVLGRAMGGYPDERYVDLRRLDVLRPIIGRRLDTCRRKGFDGVEPDIDDAAVDVGAAGIGFPVTYADQLAFDAMVAHEAHARGLAIGLKNGTASARLVADVEPLVDFAVNEQCAASGTVCGELRVFVAHGKPVFHAEYLSDYPGSSTASPSGALNAFCPPTRALGFSSILKDSSDALAAWRAPCP